LKIENTIFRQECLRGRAAVLGRSESARTALSGLLCTVLSTVAAVSAVFVEEREGGGGRLRRFVEGTAEPSLLLLGGVATSVADPCL
jgi:hypothetical protein